MSAPPIDALSRLPRPPGARVRPSSGGRRWTSRRVLAGALAASLIVHLALSLWPAVMPTTPDATPLQVAITELPPPPKPVPVRAAPKPKPKRALPQTPAQTAPEPEPVATDATPPAEPSPDAGPAMAEAAAPPVAPSTDPAPAEAVAAAPKPVVAEPPPKTLPPRVDLAYKVFLGTQGFLIGEATYRFEHTGSHYQIATVGEARGLAALLIRGQGRIESRGLITPTGLQPQEFSIERGSKDRREVALFDWASLSVTLHEQNTAALELPTYDPLALMWQFYFSPPVADQQTFNIATTRRVMRYPSPAKPARRSSGPMARSRPNAGTGAATTEGPTATSGLRRPCITSP